MKLDSSKDMDCMYVCCCAVGGFRESERDMVVIRSQVGIKGTIIFPVVVAGWVLHQQLEKRKNNRLCWIEDNGDWDR